jgi:hypothetical protein
MKASSLQTLLILSFVSLSCAQGNCRMQKDATSKDTDSVAANANVATAAQDRIRVFKYDGSKQCGQGKAIPLTKMQTELKKIPVYSAENKSDRLMHMQMCGTNTGTANVYEIDRNNLEAAQKAGFREWTFE